MKTKILLFLLILLTTIGFAQTTETEKAQNDTEEISPNESEPIPFKLVEVPPLGPDCKAKWKREKQKDCTAKFIINHINRKFNTELASDLGLTGRIRIDVSFIIDKEGKSIYITATGGPDIMNQEAIEVIQKLPQLTPAMQNGKTVEVSYKLPILFDIV